MKNIQLRGFYTSIKAPTFTVRFKNEYNDVEHQLNEYEVRNLQVEIAEGLRKHDNYTIIGKDNNPTTFREDGFISDELPDGFSLNTKLSYKLL